MSQSSEHVLERAYFLGVLQAGQRRKSPVATLHHLQVRLQMESTVAAPKVLVLPGWLDGPTWEVLAGYGGPDWPFCNEHARGGPSRIYRHSAKLACRWRFPQVVPDGCECRTPKYSTSLGDVVLLSASLWVKKVPMLLITRPTLTSIGEPFIYMSLEDELVVASLVKNMTFDSFLNLLIYERWDAFVAALRPCDMSREMIFEVTKALEWNYEQAREVSCVNGRQLYLADVEAWKEMLRKLKRRLDITALGIKPGEGIKSNEEVGLSEEIMVNEEAGADEESWGKLRN